MERERGGLTRKRFTNILHKITCTRKQQIKLNHIHTHKTQTERTKSQQKKRSCSCFHPSLRQEKRDEEYDDDDDDVEHAAQHSRG